AVLVRRGAAEALSRHATALSRERSVLALRLRHVLIDEDRIPIGIGEREVRRSIGGLVGLGIQLDAALLRELQQILKKRGVFRSESQPGLKHKLFFSN